MSTHYCDEMCISLNIIMLFMDCLLEYPYPTAIGSQTTPYRPEGCALCEIPCHLIDEFLLPSAQCQCFKMSSYI